MKKANSRFWTPEEMQKLIELASDPTIPMAKIAKQYGITPGAVYKVLQNKGVHREITKKRRAWHLNALKADYRQKIMDAMIASGGVRSKAAKLLFLSRSSLQHHICSDMFTDDERKRMHAKPGACVVCGKSIPIEPQKQRRVVCSPECSHERHLDLMARRRRKRGIGWDLYKPFHYDVVVNALMRHGGCLAAVASEMNVNRMAMASAVQRWGLRELAAQCREKAAQERLQYVAEMLSKGESLRSISRSLKIDAHKLGKKLKQHNLGWQRRKHCKVCGKSMPDGGNTAMYCSRGCYNTKRRQVNADKRAKKVKHVPIRQVDHPKAQPKNYPVL